MRLTAAIAPALIATIALGACASKTTVQTRNGPATITTSQGGGKVTVQTSEGTTSIGLRVDARKLGIPVYPPAQLDPQGSITTDASVIAAFRTSDSFDKVYAYYKRLLPRNAEKMKVTSGNGSVVSFQIGDPNTPEEITVQVSSDQPNETEVLITHVTRKAGSASPTATVR